MSYRNNPVESAHGYTTAKSFEHRFDGTMKYNKVPLRDSLSRAVKEANSSAKRNRRAHAWLLWSKWKRGLLQPSSVEAVCKDYAVEFTEFERQEGKGVKV